MKIALKACAALLLAAATPIHAQDYPKGSVTLVIPLAPGDATDTSARAIADELSRELKVAIVPVNRPGAGGSLGTELVVKSKPDGYTIILTNNASLVFLDPRSQNHELQPAHRPHAARTRDALAQHSRHPRRRAL